MIDLYGDNTAVENEAPASPAEPEAPVAPEPSPDPDVVIAEQFLYTRAIQDTAWATLASWTPGAPIPVPMLLGYVQNAGYTATVSVEADSATGVVTITATTGTQVSTADWTAFDGTLGVGIVATTIPWTSVGSMTPVPIGDTVPLPEPNHLISLWSHLERQGVQPASLYRRYDAANDQQEVVLHTYGPVGGEIEIVYGEYQYGEVNNSLVNDFAYRTVDGDEVRRFDVKAVTNPFADGPGDSLEGLLVMLKPDVGLGLETGHDFGDAEDVSDEAPISGPTATMPTQVQETPVGIELREDNVPVGRFDKLDISSGLVICDAGRNVARIVPSWGDGFYNIPRGNQSYTRATTDELLSLKSNVGHAHDTRYYTEAEVLALLALLEPVSATGDRDTSATNTGSLAPSTLSEPHADIAINPAMAHRVTVRFYGFLTLAGGGVVGLTVGDAVTGSWGGTVIPNPSPNDFYINPVVVHTWEQAAGPPAVQARVRWETGAATGYSVFQGSMIDVEAKPYFT